MKNIELLMPAGNLEKLEYAVRYGANAVYLGVVDFSLRAMRKGNLITLENLKDAVDLAHRLGAKAYVTLNIFAFNNDIKLLEQCVDIFKDAIEKMVDRSCSEEFEHELLCCATETEGVTGVDLIRTRMFGNKIYVDLEIRADGEITLSQSHAIAENLHNIIEEKFKDVKHIMIHVNPEE